jgi:hypothetical protein
MADFVVYHNPDRMGYSARKVTAFRVVTNKDVPLIIGSRIWLITGDGRPRTYSLIGHLTAMNRRRNAQTGFAWEISAPLSAGIQIPASQWPELNHEPWWDDFLASQGNFGFGLQIIRDLRFIKGLEDVLSRARLG